MLFAADALSYGCNVIPLCPDSAIAARLASRPTAFTELCEVRPLTRKIGAVERAGSSWPHSGQKRMGVPSNLKCSFSNLCAQFVIGISGPAHRDRSRVDYMT